MPSMLGDRLLPQSVQTRRRQVRSKLQDLRQPVKSRRESIVPGPNLVGKAENRFSSAKDRFLQRQTVLQRIKSMRQSQGQNQSSSSSGSSSGSGSSQSNSPTMT